MPKIKAGIATYLGIISSVALALKPATEQVVALVENTSVHWTSAEKTSLISGAVVAGVTIISRAAQAVAHIISERDKQTQV
jgi:hypothetical protein